jgi:large exoprotein involved in heme utilization and adhesion
MCVVSLRQDDAARAVLLSAKLKRETGIYRGWHRSFTTVTAVAALMMFSRPGFAGPTGGTVVQGSAGIQQSGATTNINQSTNKAIINWQGFSINSGETVNFNQPAVLP